MSAAGHKNRDVIGQQCFSQSFVCYFCPVSIFDFLLFNTGGFSCAAVMVPHFELGRCLSPSSHAEVVVWDPNAPFHWKVNRRVMFSIKY